MPLKIFARKNTNLVHIYCINLRNSLFICFFHRPNNLFEVHFNNRSNKTVISTLTKNHFEIKSISFKENFIKLFPTNCILWQDNCISSIPLYTVLRTVTTAVFLSIHHALADLPNVYRGQRIHLPSIYSPPGPQSTTAA